MSDDDMNGYAPGEDEAEDFANFDPRTYMRRRALDRGRGSEMPLDEPAGQAPDDFTNFDPDRYLRKRQARLGRTVPGEVSSGASYTERARRRRRRAGADDDDFGDVGAGAGFLAALGSRENTRFIADFLSEGGPMLRPMLVGVGCFLLLAAIGACTLLVLVLNTLGRR